MAGIAALLAACGGSSRAPALTGVSCANGSTAPVCLTPSTGVFQLQQNTSFNLTATVPTDSTNAGVTWTVNGGGSLSNVTTSTATYTAPSGVTGTVTPTITATSIADTTKTITVAVAVFGTPVIDPINLFPGNLNTPYGTYITVSGGLGPYTWTLNSGTLPPGMTLGTLTTYNNTLSGTPTATGTYSFQVKVTDANSATATVNLTVTINAAESCLLNGQYAVLYTGYTSSQASVAASSLTVSSTGTVSGIQDFNAPAGVVSETVTGTCTTRSATTTSNTGTLTITGATHSPQYDYAVTIGLDSGRVQLMNGGDTQSGTGQFIKQDPAAFTLASVAGSYAFGVQGKSADGTHSGLAGTLTLDATGTVMAGRVDSNDAADLHAASVTGTMSAPDANGRGTLVLTAASGSYHFVYVVVDANRLFLVGTDSGAAATAGFMTRQNGTFDATSLASPGIVSLWGAVKSIAPMSVVSVGRLSNGSAGAGTIDLHLDTANLINPTYDAAVTGATYTVDGDGHATLSYASGGTTHQFALYLYGAASGYLLEHGSASGNVGLLEAQSAGPFSSTLPGLFVFGTQFPQDVAPMATLPEVRLSAGLFSSGSGSGYYSLDTATGRGLGTLTITGNGGTVVTFYVVNPAKVVLLRFGAKSRSATLEWLGS